MLRNGRADQASIPEDENKNRSFESDADCRPHPDVAVSEHMCVTVCTRERPQMLMACLRSVLPQLEASAAKTSLVVVENDDRPRNRGGGGFDLAHQHPSVHVEYRLEPELGIPFARNTAVETALALGADWIFFIDDDEEACDGWFEAHLAAIRAWDAEMFRGPVKYIYPDDQPEWLRMPEFDGGPTGSVVKAAYTGNLAAKACIFAGDGLGLRFSSQFRFSGGEDVDFSRRAVANGACVRWVREAIVSEVQDGNRLTAGWFLNRAERKAAVKLILLAQDRGRGAAGRQALVRCPRLFLQAGLKMLTLPFLTLTSKRSGSEIFLRARLKLYCARGYIRCVSYCLPDPYAYIEDRRN
ncbi:glycosyltransferase family 2 protein [Dichotomicrobium thermohalophilum]|uniref:GT2 family glycosyltransferase n=1 Tax=Dichotomicrobium thermohalophilum TaxID=933063 RepID=A0A397QCQ8_9HYPH|nr:glycosyltransferase [Dichotomicrobium thermohalophilum]RIA56041.1 GT2 family glycosyltransferase [Dichotomicrobium thermohalophilum]